MLGHWCDRHFPEGRVALGVLACIATALLGLTDRPSQVMTVCQAVGETGVPGGQYVLIRGRVISGFETFALGSQDCTTDNRVAALIWLDIPPVDDQPYAR